MKKRFLQIAIACAMAAMLIGCGASKDEGTESAPVQEVQNEAGVTGDDVDTEAIIEETESVESTEETTEVAYTYTDLDKTLYAKQSVNVRDIPSSDGTKLGALSFAQEVHVTGQCNETSWYRIEYNGAIAYVSNSYLQDTKPEQQINQSASNGGGSNTGATSNGGNTYTLPSGRVLEYGVLYINVCGNNLTGKEQLQASLGPFPYPLWEKIDNGDGNIIMYMPANHAAVLDGETIFLDVSKTSETRSQLFAEGYDLVYEGGDNWHSCVGGYDEGCIHKYYVVPLVIQ